MLAPDVEAMTLGRCLPDGTGVFPAVLDPGHTQVDCVLLLDCGLRLLYRYGALPKC